MSLSRNRRSALLMALPAFVEAMALLHHPRLELPLGTGDALVVGGLRELAVVNAAFHLGILVALVLQAVGLWTLADSLGSRRLDVRTGYVFYVLATALFACAASIDGLATAALAQFGAGAAHNSTSIVESLRTLAAAVQGFTRTGLFAQGMAMAFWSIAVLQDRKNWLAALVGFALALGLTVSVIGNDAPIDPRRLPLALLLPAIWTLAAAAWLWLRPIDVNTRQGHERFAAASHASSSRANRSTP